MDSKISLPLTYLEQYRVDFNQRSKLREKDCIIMVSLINSLQVEYPTADNPSFEYLLVLAQWYYLGHTIHDNENVREIVNATAQCMIEKSLHFSLRFLQYSHPAKIDVTLVVNLLPTICHVFYYTNFLREKG